MTKATWDPTDTGGWALSNGNLTAASPDNNTKGNIFVGYGTPAIPDDALTYYEIKVSGAAVQTAFTVGFGVHGFNPSNQNTQDEGAIIPNATFLGFAYNRTITNSGNVIYDPQQNWDLSAPVPHPAPNQWSDGSIVGVLVDRVNNTAEFTLNGVAQGGFFDISGMTGKTLYPFVDSWYKSGPVATINGGTAGFAEALPAGYTALDGTGGSGSGGTGSGGTGSGGTGSGGTGSGGTGSTSNTIKVNEPSPLVAGQDTISGHETDASQPVYLDWRTYGAAPSVGASDAVKATVSSNGDFTASVTIDRVGTQSTMYVGSSGVMSAAWSATPVASSGGSGGGGSGSTGSGSGGSGSTGSGGGTGAASGGSGSPSTVTIGSGPDTLALKVSEDAWQGNAQFTVSVDGTQIGGTQTATGSHSAGQTQTFNVLGTFAPGTHTATVNFINDAYGGSASADRNLYVTGASIDGTVVPGATITNLNGGPRSFNFVPPGTTGSGSGSGGSGSTGSGSGGSSGGGGSPSTVTIGSGSDTLALKVSEDAWQGNAQFTVSVDGTQIGGTQTATGSHSAGQTQTFNVLGTFAPGTHTATVNFINDAYGGSASADRNLYVTGASIDGTVVSGATISNLNGGPRSFSFIAPGTTGSSSGTGSGSTSDAVTVNKPTSLAAGLNTITGTESDPSQSIFLDWRTYGAPPVIGATDWVQATVGSNGSFSAPVSIDHPGVQSTMYYRVGTGPTVAAWTATPS